ncbi:MAG: HAMP domain-containing histidine kinase [Melioribacteraceae bacterium]|nr:HAMP domain-containing histidine kinase [Melioribacteraceae bacterium]
MKTKFLLIFIFITNISFSQNENFIVELNYVKVNDELKYLNNLNELNVLPNDKIEIHYKAITNIKGNLFYRIFIDATLIESKTVDTIFTINKLKMGVNLIRIVAFFENGIESQSLVLPIKVTEKLVTEENKLKENVKVESQQESNNYLLYLFAAVVIVQFIIIILLITIRKKSNSQNKVYKNELDEIKYSYKRAKEELNKQREENENLKKQIKELDENVKTLEKTNVKLVEQKEKLAESKARLEYLHTQKEEMFAIAIHDIKNPASAIKGYIELLNSYELTANEQHEIMESLVASSDDIVKLSQKMCTIIAKAMPEPKIKFVEYSINQIIESVYNQNTSYAKAKKVKLFNKSSNDLPNVKIDPEKIEEALDNLVNNAIKYAPPETVVEIKSYVKEGAKRMVVVEVKDTGYGLSEDDLKRSFQKGAILSNKPTGLEQSSGLGLWIVKRIIEEHNGKVWVESKLNIGSTFAFELPIE